MCNNCSFETNQWLGQCPSCQEWGTLSEYKVSKNQKTSLNGKKKDAQSLEDILHKEEEHRTSVGIKEVDRVLGGGGLSGSMI